MTASQSPAKLKRKGSGKLKIDPAGHSFVDIGRTKKIIPSPSVINMWHFGQGVGI
jgi:hypothetical protein